MKSYSSESRSWGAFFAEARSLYAAHSWSVADRVRNRIDDIKEVEARIKEPFGLELRDMDILEIGPGQFLTQLTYLALENRAVGIDLDVITHGLDLGAYLRMLRGNGLRRTLKTLGRKLLGVDRKYAMELARQLHVGRCPKPRVRAMDVCDLRFPDASFDFVYSRSVLQHVPEPGKALREVSRVLRPGGVAYISVHLYTSETGSLDPRVFEVARQEEIRGWPHLRPHLRDSMRANAFLNKLRAHQWEDILAKTMPRARLIANISTSPFEAERIRASAMTLQEKGELSDYSLKELETFELVFLWRKPTPVGRTQSRRRVV